MDDVDERVSLSDPLGDFLALFLLDIVIRLVERQNFHSLIWSGDEQGYIAKSRCLEIYQIFEEK